MSDIVKLPPGRAYGALSVDKWSAKRKGHKKSFVSPQTKRKEARDRASLKSSKEKPFYAKRQRRDYQKYYEAPVEQPQCVLLRCNNGVWEKIV